MAPTTNSEASGPSLRLDLLSPLPPVRSGISDYTVDLLPHLAKLADVRLLRIEDQAIDPEIMARYQPAAAERVGEDGRLPLYQVGNNPYHDRVIELARQHPGVVTLHDIVLHHQLLESTVARQDWHGYEVALRTEHGALGEAVSRAWRWGSYGTAAQFALTAHASLLEVQRGVLVHSAWAAAILREEFPDLPVRVVPMPVPLPAEVSPADRTQARAALGVPAGVPLIGSFGFQSPVKRTAVAVEALARPELQDVWLVVAGQVAPGYDLAGLARRLGVERRVILCGFLEFADLERAIAACDLCVNLRYPSAGETSASLLRILAVGRPSVVSDYAQFRDLPSELVLRVPLDEFEVENLATSVADLLASPTRLESMATRARSHVADVHDPQRSAAAIVAACRQFAPANAAAAARAPSPGALTSLTASSLPGELAVEGVSDWREGERRRIGVRLRNTGEARWLAVRDACGGLALEVHLLDAGGADALEGLPWLPLRQDLEPGASVLFEFEARRPVGAARLSVIPRVVGRERLQTLGGPVWEDAV